MWETSSVDYRENSQHTQCLLFTIASVLFRKYEKAKSFDSSNTPQNFRFLINLSLSTHSYT